jgi:hypothetical protein
MKTKFSILISAIVLSCNISAGTPKTFQQKEKVRIEKTINTQWTFNYFPEEKADKNGCEAPNYDDSKWSAIALPHTWMT